MFRCRICGSIGQTPQACGVCGGAAREISEDPSGLLSLLPVTDFARITRSILQTATVALIIIQISSARPAHLLRPTRRRTVIVSHIHSHKARTVLFPKERSRYRGS